jgi:PAS domain S-box-containing protein
MINKKILIVEDEPIIALELSERLQQYGYNIVGIASNGVDAQKKFKSNNADLILLDISLKGDINGIDFATIIRKTSDIPIIYITAFSDEPTLAKAKLTQPSGFLLKPFNQRELETTIEISLYKYEMEKKIKDNERWLNSTLDGIGDAIITTDRNGLINFANSAAEQVIGLSKSEMMSRKVDSVIEYLDAVLQLSISNTSLVDSIKDLESGSFTETILVNHRKEKLYVEQKTTLLRDDYGDISGNVFVIRDLTAKKNIQSALEKSEERYKAVIEQISDGIIIYDFQSKKVIETNKAYRKMTGYTEEELLQMTSKELVYENGIFIKEFDEIIEKQKQLFVGERIHKKKDGSIINVEVSSNLLEMAGIEVLVVVVRDITERKKAEEAIISSEEKLRTLFDTMAQGVIYQDSTGRIQSANQAACKILGVSIKDLMGTFGSSSKWRAISENGSMLSDDDHPSSHALKTGREIIGQTIGIFNQAEDRYKWITVSCIPHHTPDQKNVLSVFTTFTDITDLKNSEEALKKYGEELKHVIATKDRFFSIVAHDLKSPFLGLLGFTNALHEDFDQFETEQIRRYIGNINKATRNIYGLIQNLLEWSRLQTNKIELSICEVDIFQQAEYSINLLNTNATSKDIKIINDLPQSEMVLADERVLDSVFSNLISNAIKFSKRGGSITILSATLNDYLEVCVADNGVGMDEEKINDLFRLDVTVSSRGTEGEIGTGLGLVLCRELIEKLNGKMRVESVPDLGSKFFFTIPRVNTN